MCRQPSSQLPDEFQSNREAMASNRRHGFLHVKNWTLVRGMMPAYRPLPNEWVGGVGRLASRARYDRSLQPQV
jgi:hypothetical protein